MGKFFKVNLITLGATLAVYGFILRPRAGTLNQVLNSIPFFQQQKKKIFTEVGKEALKIVGTYFLLNTLRIR